VTGTEPARAAEHPNTTKAPSIAVKAISDRIDAPKITVGLRISSFDCRTQQPIWPLKQAERLARAIMAVTVTCKLLPTIRFE
ncbi:MAG: hypothetical protein QOF56_1215, partial [Acidobacteriaceae bacterium]|nr:hypothetical protein [Acidobacteriaceae bacterium]